MLPRDVFGDWVQDRVKSLCSAYGNKNSWIARLGLPTGIMISSLISKRLSCVLKQALNPVWWGSGILFLSGATQFSWGPYPLHDFAGIRWAWSSQGSFVAFLLLLLGWLSCWITLWNVLPRAKSNRATTTSTYALWAGARGQHWALWTSTGCTWVIHCSCWAYENDKRLQELGCRLVGGVCKHYMLKHGQQSCTIIRQAQSVTESLTDMASIRSAKDLYRAMHCLS